MSTTWAFGATEARDGAASASPDNSSHPSSHPSRCDLHPRRRAWLSSWKACAGYPGHVSAERDELRELVERLPDEEVPAVLSVARRHLGDPSGRAWPPAFFGAGRAGRTDVAERAEELLDEGFGQLA